MRTTHWRVAIVAVAATVFAGACDRTDGGEGGAELSEMPEVSVPAADLGAIDEAIAATDRELGGAQQYFEVTANAQNVRLFVRVADEDPETDTVQSYVFLRGEVVESGEPAEGAQGFTFGASDVDFDEEVMLASIAAEVPDATVEELSIVGTQDGPPRYATFVRSARGGRLDVVLGPDGEVREVGRAN